MRERFGPYQVIAELGRGGMGAVYKAFEPELNRHVAIKVMSEALAHDPVVVERFLREARAMAALSDPHIIQIYTIGTEEGQPYFAMEYIEGESLSAKLKREGKLAPAEALSILHQTALGLAAAHDRGVIHRDIKPGNLMLTRRGLVKIADFGIALSSRDLSRKLTSTGEFVGTPGYLSPEVCLGKPVDARSDIFSLGIVFFEMLTGQIPFKDESPLGLMLEVVKAEIPDVRELASEVDEGVAQILRRMIAKEPEDRFQDCHQLAAAAASHPLLVGRATGYATTRQEPRQATAGATVVAQPTPASLRAPVSPPRVETLHRDSGSLVKVEPARPAARRSLAPLAAVAGLVLLVGSVWAFREQLPFLKPQAESAAVAATPKAGEPASPPAARNPEEATVRGGDAIAARPSGTATGGASLLSLLVGSKPQPVAALEATPESAAATGANEGAVAESGNVGSAAPVTVPSADDRVQESTAAAQGGSAPPPASEPVAAAKSSAPPAKTEAAGATVAVAASPAESAAKGRAAATETRLARREPPAVRSVPRLVIVAVGDPIITRPAEQRLSELLAGEGFELLDAELVPGLSGLRDAIGVDLAELMRRLKPHAELLVLIRAEPLGSQVLTYYGEASTLYSANLQVRAYSVAENRALGAGWREKVDFTSLNAEQQAAQAMRPHLSALINALAPYRPARRG
jgi:serine/threonine-protein kinase